MEKTLKGARVIIRFGVKDVKRFIEGVGVDQRSCFRVHCADLRGDYDEH